MIINTTPQNQAVLSNVGEIGEFRIRNSAKAFSILSSGLYSNKIRAIVRELSCNAYDSHVAAGRKDLPFEVHLPNALEPWFSVRDFGVGLDYNDVLNIYTTYFESTKTESNDYVGALGLGSKSPFSYTDNFTVNAVKNGRRGIYSAFINEHGVPSIAVMHEELTDDAPGVEVKFSVHNQYDFYKFGQEAQHVFRYFSVVPVIKGQSDLSIDSVVYKEKDIIPGVHWIQSHSRKSYAIMGNIAYPIDIPNSDTNLGSLKYLLDSALEIHFDIGELDFQASREGLSYIPQTIAAIRSRLEKVDQILYQRLCDDIEKITNIWQKTYLLLDRRNQTLWINHCKKYMSQHKLETFDERSGITSGLIKPFVLFEHVLADKYNIKISAFAQSHKKDIFKTLRTQGETFTNDDDTTFIQQAWKIQPLNTTKFVINDTNQSAIQRVKNHWRNFVANGNSNDQIFVINAEDRKKPVQIDLFFKDILLPPSEQILKASGLDKPEPKVAQPKQKTCQIQKYTNTSHNKHKWVNSKNLAEFNNTETYYYVSLNKNQAFDSQDREISVADLVYKIKSNSEIFGIFELYGVRKQDLESVKNMSNWVPLDVYITNTLAAVSDELLTAICLEDARFWSSFTFQQDIVNKIAAKDSLYLKFVNKNKRRKFSLRIDRQYLRQLSATYCSDLDQKLAKASTLIESAKQILEKKYPMLAFVNWIDGRETMIADYVNLVDRGNT
jgi:hypothetical protein